MLGKSKKNSCSGVTIVPEEDEEEAKCAICGKGKVSLLQANHKEVGNINVCQDCWCKLSDENMLVSGSGGSSGGGCCGSGGGCCCR